MWESPARPERKEPNRKTITQSLVDRTHPPPLLPGFGLRISSKGRKTWTVKYRVKGKEYEKKVGTALELPNVADARDRPVSGGHRHNPA